MTKRAWANLIALVVFVVLWSLFVLWMLYVLFGGPRPYNIALSTTPTPKTYNSGHVQVTGLFQGWYHMGNCIYIEPDTGCDIDG